MSSIFEDCQIWIEKGEKTWKSFFSKWETYAKYEEDIPESELMYELNEKQKMKNQIHKKVKQSQKRVKSVIFRKLQNKQKKIVKKKIFKKTAPDKTDKDVMGETSNEKNLIEISENNEFEKTLKVFCSEFLKSNKVFSVLFQTFSGEETQMKCSENLFLEQKMSFHNFEFNLQKFSMAEQHFFSLPRTGVDSGLRSICPPRDAYIQGLGTGVKAAGYEPGGESSLVGHWRNSTFETPKNVHSWNKKRHFSFFGNMTPPSGQKPNLEIKSCPPSFSSTRFENGDLKFGTRLCEKINNSFQNTAISKMSITHGGKGPGTFCLHKRTNSVSLVMKNSNFITPERKSSEQKCFNKIVSQKRRPSKKLFFDTEENESESDDETEYYPLVIRRQNKRQKVDESETKVVDSDSDDCDAIFDRISKA